MEPSEVGGEIGGDTAARNPRPLLPIRHFPCKRMRPAVIPAKQPQLDMSETQPPAPPSEADLVRAVQAGNTAAFEPLVDTHLDHVRAYIALRLPQPHLVDELAHETFVFAFRHIAGFTAGTAFRAWLRAIAANLMRAELQRYARAQAHQLDYSRALLIEADLVATQPADAPEVEYLRDCLASLPPHARELIELKYTHNHPIDTIATRLQRTENSIWQALFRLRAQLRECLERKLRNPA